jgi:hypothetical protein
LRETDFNKNGPSAKQNRPDAGDEISEAPETGAENQDRRRRAANEETIPTERSPALNTVLF